MRYMRITHTPRRTTVFSCSLRDHFVCSLILTTVARHFPRCLRFAALFHVTGALMRFAGVHHGATDALCWST